MRSSPLSLGRPASYMMSDSSAPRAALHQRSLVRNPLTLWHRLVRRRGAVQWVPQGEDEVISRPCSPCARPTSPDASSGASRAAGLLDRRLAPVPLTLHWHAATAIGHGTRRLRQRCVRCVRCRRARRPMSIALAARAPNGRAPNLAELVTGGFLQWRARTRTMSIAARALRSR